MGSIFSSNTFSSSLICLFSIHGTVIHRGTQAKTLHIIIIFLISWSYFRNIFCASKATSLMQEFLPLHALVYCNGNLTGIFTSRPDFSVHFILFQITQSSDSSAHVPRVSLVIQSLQSEAHLEGKRDKARPVSWTTTGNLAAKALGWGKGFVVPWKNLLRSHALPLLSLSPYQNWSLYLCLPSEIM